MVVKIAVVGAGVVGLSSAVSIQQTIPQAHVTILADKFGVETVSSGAGGSFRPNILNYVPEQRESVKRWIRNSWKHYNGLAMSPDAAESGAGFSPSILSHHKPFDEEYSLLKEVAFDFHRIPQTEMAKLGLAGKYEYGYSVTTIIVQTWKYMGWLMNKFKNAGGIVQNRHVKNFSELCSEFDIVVNCCGLRSEVVNDVTTFPVKGHIVMLHAPWWKIHFYSQDGIYIIPHEDKINVGGIFQEGNYDLTPEPAMREHILSRAFELFPQLKNAPILKEWCGLRPGRPSIRLEKELLNCGPGRPLPVVHNYGHGGAGVTLSWGCAQDTARHVDGIVRDLTPPMARL